MAPVGEVAWPVPSRGLVTTLAGIGLTLLGLRVLWHVKRREHPEAR